MFSSKSKDAAQSAAAGSSSVPPPKQRPIRGSSAPSIISTDLVVEGTLRSTGDIQIDGRVEGDVHSAGLVIGDKALINGEIFAEEVTIRGTIHGSIRAHKVLLCSTCHVEGNILHEAFAVETGAFFEGNCRHADNPLAEDATPRIPQPMPRAAAPVVNGMSAPAPAPVAATAQATMASMQRPVDATAARPAGTAFAPLKPAAR